MRSFCLACSVLALWIFSLSAYPHALDPESIDRHTELTFTPSNLILIYQVILGIKPTERETRKLDADGDGTISDSERDSYVKKASEKYRKSQILRLGDRELTLQFIQGDAYASFGHNGINVIKIDIGYTSPLPADLPRNTMLSFSYEDRNIMKISGWKQINATARDGVKIEGHIPYREYAPFDYELINEKGFMPATDSIKIAVSLPPVSDTGGNAPVVLPDQMNPILPTPPTIWGSVAVGSAAVVALMLLAAIAVKLRR